jgi:hypothetical protein
MNSDSKNLYSWLQRFGRPYNGSITKAYFITIKIYNAITLLIFDLLSSTIFFPAVSSLDLTGLEHTYRKHNNLALTIGKYG